MSSRMSALLITTVGLTTMISCSSEAEFASGGTSGYDQVASRVFNFKSSKIIPQTMTLTDGGRYTSLEITQMERAPSQVLQRQVRRQSFSESFVQGHPARYSEEEFQLSEAGMLDFLVVVDNSRSMNDEREMVGRGLAPLISAFNDTNWQIAVISMSNPCLDSSNLIKKSDPNASAKFADAVRKSVDWQATEQGFPMAIKALRGQCGSSTRQWLREDSSVGILFVSDEDNCGSDAGEQSRCANVEGKNAAEMVRALRAIRSPEQGRMYAIVDKDGSCPDAGGVGSMYVDAMNQTNGTAGSICNDYSSANGYGPYLTGVSSDVSRIIRRQFRLSSTPDMAQFNVYVDGKLASGGVISVNGKMVTIDPAAFKDGAKIKFGYSHDAVPMFSSVVLKTSPSPETLKVSVNGRILQSGSEYQYDASSRKIVFTAMPPDDAGVQVSYLEDKPLLTKFPVDLTGARPETLKISVNGVNQSEDKFLYEDSGVEFREPPIDGALVSISWRTEAHKIRDYGARITDQRKPVAWQVSDKVSGESVPAVWDGSTLKFDYEYVVEGRVVVFTVDFGEKSMSRSISLPTERIDDDVKILADEREGVCAVDPPPVPEGNSEDSVNTDAKLEETQKSEWKSRYKGKQIQIKCAPGVDYSRLQIQYSHETERTGSFLVKLSPGVDPDDPMLIWTVYVDGVKSKDFQRSGTLVSLDADKLPPETRVDVEVTTYTLVGK